MMKELLELYFGKHYQSPKSVSVISDIRKGRFSLSDSKACSDCNIHTPETEIDCDKIVVNFDTDEREVEVIQFETFVDNYNNLKAIPNGSKCDLLLVGEDKIVFCDMTCSMSTYIEPYVKKDGTERIGKRETVKRQIANSISLLLNVQEIAPGVGKKKEKIALFAYRVKGEKLSDSFDSKVISKMQSFGVNRGKLAKELMYSDMDNGFLFTEIKYPEVYSW